MAAGLRRTAGRLSRRSEGTGPRARRAGSRCRCTPQFTSRPPRGHRLISPGPYAHRVHLPTVRPNPTCASRRLADASPPPSPSRPGWGCSSPASAREQHPPHRSPTTNWPTTTRRTPSTTTCRSWTSSRGSSPTAPTSSRSTTARPSTSTTRPPRAGRARDHRPVRRHVRLHGGWSRREPRRDLR